MAQLLATLRAASGQTLAFTTATGNGFQTAANAAKLKDASDATMGIGYWAPDGVIVDAGYVVEDWVVDTLGALTGLTITKVVVQSRHRKNVTGTAGQPATIRPRINSVDRGTGVTGLGPPITLTTTITTAVLGEFTTDPADGLPWTPAKINAQKWGWKGDGANLDIFADELWIRVYEFWVFVYGEYQTTPSSIDTQDSAAAGMALMPNSIDTRDALAAGMALTPNSIETQDALPVVGYYTPASIEDYAQSGFGGESYDPGTPTEGTYQPETVTAFPVLLRAANPAVLGDGSAADSGLRDGPVNYHPTFDVVFSAIKANTMQDSTETAAIGYVKLYVNGYFMLPLPRIYEETTDAKIRYTTPAGTAEASASPLSNWTTANTIGSLGPAGWRTISTDPLLLRPDGLPWTWADINGMTDVAPIITISGLDEFVDVTNVVTEIWVEVYGAIGGVGPPVQDIHNEKKGHGFLDSFAGPDVVSAQEGRSSIKLKTQTDPDEGP